MLPIELEKLAAAGNEMPSNLNAAEQLFFLSLRCLYIAYHVGKLHKDAAKREKTAIYKQYEINALDLKCWENSRRREEKLAVLSPELKSSGCELCRRYAHILSGLEPHECNNVMNKKIMTIKNRLIFRRFEGEALFDA